jgi:Na+/proline symporter
LRYTVAGLQVLTSVIYVAAQVNALKSTFNSMFGIDPESPVAVIIMFIIILAFEWAGGLSSVALTDAVQGFIMILSFLMLSGVVKKNFGGWSDLDPVTYPKVSSLRGLWPKVNYLFIAV